MLGEVSKERSLKNVRRIIAGKDEILTALFERTYSALSNSAKRIFLTLCHWRNILPEIAIEAVLNREENEFIKVEEAIEELHRYSFIELIKSILDESVFISVPLTAFEFGKKKLSVSPLKTKIQSDIVILNYFGITQFTDINKGINPKIEQFFKNIALNVRSNKETLVKHLPLIEFICRRYPKAWLFLVNIFLDFGEVNRAIDALQNFVADYRVEMKEKVSAWEFQYRLYSIQRNYSGAAQSLVEMCKIEEIEFNDLSNAVRCLMNIFKEQKTKFKKEEIQILLGDVAEKMNLRISKGEGSTSDYSQLAWVYLYLDKRDKAKTFTKLALARNPESIHAQNLKRILQIR